MWKILVLVLFGTLVNFSEGKKLGIISMLSFAEYESVVGSQLKKDGLLQNQLKKIALEDIQLSGLLGLININGLNIADVVLTTHKLNYVPGLRGAEMITGIRLSIGGSLLAGIPSLIKISVEFQSSVKFELTDYQAGSLRVIFRECNILFGDITIEILSVNLTPTALNTIKNSIIGNINIQICNILQIAVDVVRDRLLDTMNVVIPFEPFGSLRCQLASLPNIIDNILWLHLFVDFDIRGQGLLSIPDSAPDIILPPLEKYRYCQCVHAAVFNIFLSVVLRIQPQEFSCTPNVPPPFISSAILYFRISLLQSPVLHLGNGFAIVEVSAQIEFFVKNSDGSRTSIVILQTSLSLSATFSVTNGYLRASLSISGHKVALISSALGITDVSSIEPLCGNLMGETFLFSLNARSSPVYLNQRTNPAQRSSSEQEGESGTSRDKQGRMCFLV
ncbi:BPI fold-containing family B member 4-like [Pituophis catenifer annectens]|uniref:BPI fold-containing family B member 4-like n=1 Tax=Pituophis catenifer annectens TaxID=94852 RepID=UPI0039936F52